MLGPVLLGRVWLIAAVTLLGILCLREYDRATGLFRERVMVAGVVAGILLINLAALERWYNFFTALFPLTVVGLAVISLPLDRPGGYIQRTGLAIFAFTLFGAGLGHIGYMGNDPNYRPFVLLLLTGVAINDVFAFTTGKLIGGPKLLPATSPNKTISGALGALVCTATLVAVIAWPIFRGTRLDRLAPAARPWGDREPRRPGGGPHAVLDQAGPRDQGHGRRHSWPRGGVGPVQLVAAGLARDVSLRHLLRRVRAGPAGPPVHG